jgi:shikimate dehydrogenase
VSEIPAADVLVNCTSVGLHVEASVAMLPLPAAGLGAFRIVADFVYREGGAALTSAARTAGVAVIDGLELLVAQGAIAFELFTGVAAPVEAMRDAVGFEPPTQ